MRHTRTALARLFTLLAIVAIPDGMPKPFIRLMEADDMLKAERLRQKRYDKGSEKK